MKSITIHGLDDQLASRIEEKAAEGGLSLNKTIKSLLRDALGLRVDAADRRSDFEDLSGVWSKKDVQAFGEATRDFQKIDKREWE